MKKTARVKKIDAIPLPEALDGEKWRINQVPARQAAVAPSLRHMRVPYGQEEMERMVRLHEMTHVKITPLEIEAVCRDLPEDLVNTVEDGRVHGHMKRMGFELDELRGVVCSHEMEDIAEKAHPAVLAAMGVAMAYTGEHKEMERHLQDEDRSMIYRYGVHVAYHRLHAPEHLPDFEVTVEIVKELMELFGDPGAPPPPPGASMTTPMPVPLEMLPYLAEKGLKPPPAKVHGSLWAKMTIEEPPLPLILPGKMRKKIKKMPEVRGRRLRRIGRLHHDGKVFSDKVRKKGGGAVLIDTSGSMSLEPDEVLQLCIAYPAGVIGAYSSDHEDAYGTLRVIARNGRRVPDDEIDPPGGGNGVDGPALDWLAKQPGPRFWISDAGVSGGPEGLAYCLDVCRRHKITRVDDAWQIVNKAWA